MSDKASPMGLRDQLGDGYLNLLDSVRHSVEQAAWGQEATGSLANDFYRWVGSPETASQGLDGVEQRQGIEASDGNWEAFAAWIDGKHDAAAERGSGTEVEKNEPEREGPELGD